MNRVIVLISLFVYFLPHLYLFPQQKENHDYYNACLGRFGIRIIDGMEVTPFLPRVTYGRYISVSIWPGKLTITSAIERSFNVEWHDGIYKLKAGSNKNKGELITDFNIAPIKYFITTDGTNKIQIMGLNPAYPKLTLIKEKSIFEQGIEQSGALTESEKASIAKREKDLIGDWSLFKDNMKLKIMPKIISFDKNLNCNFDSTFIGNWKINADNILSIMSDSNHIYRVFQFKILKNEIKLIYYYDDIGRIPAAKNKITSIFIKK